MIWGKFCLVFFFWVGRKRGNPFCINESEENLLGEKKICLWRNAQFLVCWCCFSYFYSLVCFYKHLDNKIS